jgi:hypothetical protein
VLAHRRRMVPEETSLGRLSVGPPAWVQSLALGRPEC